MQVTSVSTVVGAMILILGVSCASAPEPEPSRDRGDERDSAAVQAVEAWQHDQAVQERSDEGGRVDEEEARRQAERITDEDMARFAAGVRAVAAREAEMVEAGRDLESLRRGASSAAEARRAEREVLEEMRAALEEVELAFESFLMMAQFVRQNPILMERLGEVLEAEEIAEFYGI